MKTAGNERYSKIRLFEIFIDALRHVVKQDEILFTMPRNKAAIVHRLASHLHSAMRRNMSVSLDETKDTYMDLPGGMFVDVGLAIKPIIADIIIHDRNLERPKRLLAVICRDTYLSEDEQASLFALQESGDFELVLALSFLPQKNYLLIYRAENNQMEYYHLMRDDLACVMLKRKEVEGEPDDDQLKLAIGMRRKKTK